jgi:hypothetical protein
MPRLLISGLLLTGLLGCATSARSPRSGPGEQAPTSIMLLGCPHLTQLYKAGNPASDMLTPTRQAELSTLLGQLQRFRPDGIMVEELPERQAAIDSLYQLYRQGRLELAALPDGRSEVYQIGFALGKRLNVARIYCVNAPGGTSQSILHQGRNIELYEQATTRWRAFIRPMEEQVMAGSLTVPGFLRFVNQPANLRQLHQLVYRTPARVTDGTLKPDPMVDAAFINPHYVGAEFISTFYNRDLKVYSNVATTELAIRHQRLLLIIGARHVRSLQGILRDDPAFRVVEAADYLK